MADDDALRGICFGFLGGMQSALTSGLVPEEQRQQVIRDLQTLVRQYPHYFARQKFDLEKTPSLTVIRCTDVIVLFEANPDSLQNRTQLADPVIQGWLPRFISKAGNHFHRQPHRYR